MQSPIILEKMKWGKNNNKRSQPVGRERADYRLTPWFRSQFVIKLIWVLLDVVLAALLTLPFHMAGLRAHAKERFEDLYPYKVELVEERLLQSDQGLITYHIRMSNEGNFKWNGGTKEQFGIWLDGPSGGRWVVGHNGQTDNCQERSANRGNSQCFTLLSEVLGHSSVEADIQLQPSLDLLSGGPVLVRVGCQDNEKCMVDNPLELKIRPGQLELALVNNTAGPNPVMGALKDYAKAQKVLGVIKAGNYGDTSSQPVVVIYTAAPKSDLVSGIINALDSMPERASPPMIKSLSDYRSDWDRGVVHNDISTQASVCGSDSITWGTDGGINVGIACQDLGEFADVIVAINYR